MSPADSDVSASPWVNISETSISNYPDCTAQCPVRQPSSFTTVKATAEGSGVRYEDVNWDIGKRRNYFNCLSHRVTCPDKSLSSKCPHPRRFLPQKCLPVASKEKSFNITWGKVVKLLPARQKWKFPSIHPFLLSTFSQIHNRHGIQVQGSAKDKANTAVCRGAWLGGGGGKKWGGTTLLKGSWKLGNLLLTACRVRSQKTFVSRMRSVFCVCVIS